MKPPAKETGEEPDKDGGKPLGKERRETSQVGVLDAALKAVAQLTSLGDPNARNLANRALLEIKKAKQLVPARRKADKHQPTE